MTAKKNDTKPETMADEAPPAEPNTKVASGKKAPDLDDQGRDKAAQEAAEARNATMEPATGSGGHKSQAEIAADAKKG